MNPKYLENLLASCVPFEDHLLFVGRQKKGGMYLFDWVTEDGIKTTTSPQRAIVRLRGNPIADSIPLTITCQIRNCINHISVGEDYVLCWNKLHPQTVETEFIDHRGYSCCRICRTEKNKRQWLKTQSRTKLEKLSRLLLGETI